uniref:Selenoprotein W n=1 Tax=Canis lupus familiaris TaxID=9615 RepID=A0A8C0MYW2_CANLF
MALAVRVVYCPCDPYNSQYLQLKKKLEDEFPGCLDICGEGTPQATGFFEVTVAGKLVHSKKRGDGYVDTESKFLRLVAAIKTALAQG